MAMYVDAYAQYNLLAPNHHGECQSIPLPVYNIDFSLDQCSYGSLKFNVQFVFKQIVTRSWLFSVNLNS